MEARGKLAEIKKYFGTAKLTNLIADKTRRHEHKRRNECMGINGRPPHIPIGDEGQLGFRHNPWKSRLAIVEDILIKYKEGDEPTTPDTLYYIPDLGRFEQEFIEAHLPWDTSGKILCEKCDRDWTATWRADRRCRSRLVGELKTPIKGSFSSIMTTQSGTRDNKNRSTEMIECGYFLARCGNKRGNGPASPPEILGTTSWSRAYDLFYARLGDGRTPDAFSHSLKLTRDSFDPHFDTGRKGFWQKRLGTEEQAVFNQWRSKSCTALWMKVQSYI